MLSRHPRAIAPFTVLLGTGYPLASFYAKIKSRTATETRRRHSMQSEPMMVDPYLQHELKPGEQLLWWGRPDPKHRARTGNASGVFITNIVIYSILAFVMVGLI